MSKKPRWSVGRDAWVVAVLSTVTRALVPYRAMHVQSDDYRLWSTVRGVADASVDGFNSAHGSVLPLFEAARAIGGDSLSSAFLVAQVSGTLLPILAFLVAWEWYRDRELARVVGALFLFSPVAWVYSGAITAYMPAATAFALSLLLTLSSRTFPNRAGRVTLALVSALPLALAASLKPELISLIVVHGWLAWVGACHLDDAAEEEWLAPVPALLALFCIVVVSPQYVHDVGETIGGRSSVVGLSWMEHAAFFWLLAFPFVNPPSLPLKYALFSALARPREPGARALALSTLALAAMYALSHQSIGLNQWRHALLFLLPLNLAAAPVVLAWWKQRNTWRGRMMIATLPITAALLLAWYGLRLSRETDPVVVAAVAHDDAALVIYAPHGQDLNPAHVFGAVGLRNHVPVSELWPESCPESERVELVQVRLAALDVAARTGIATSPALFDTSNIEVALSSLSASDPPEWAQDEIARLEARVSQARSRQDPHACADALPSRRAQLARYERIYLYVDATLVEEDAVRQGGDRDGARRIRDRSELLEINMTEITLSEQLSYGEQRLFEVRAIAGLFGR